MDLMEIGCKIMKWIEMTQNHVQEQIFVLAMLTL
jgi:hypothetical protein